MSNLTRIGTLLLIAGLAACSGPTSAIPSVPSAPVVPPPVYTPGSTTAFKHVRQWLVLAHKPKTAPVGSATILKAP